MKMDTLEKHIIMLLWINIQSLVAPPKKQYFSQDFGIHLDFNNMYFTFNDYNV